jgi:hypothetical protein
MDYGFMDLSLGPFPGLEPAFRTRLGVFLCRFVDLHSPSTSS